MENQLNGHWKRIDLGGGNYCYLYETSIKCYIAGKITGLTVMEYTANFDYAVIEVNKLCYVSVNPVRIHAGKQWCWIRLMLSDIRLLLGCQAIYLQRNWKESRGARIERFVARLTRKTIIYQK